jgi:phage FluMu protein Com
MPSVNCIECGSSFYLDAIGYWNYKGKVRCPYCKALLQIEIEEGEIKSLDFAGSK